MNRNGFLSLAAWIFEIVTIESNCLMAKPARIGASSILFCFDITSSRIRMQYYALVMP